MLNKRAIQTVLMSTIAGICIMSSGIRAHAAATLEEMAQEIPMYDPVSGEYFLAENQSDADELMLEYGYVQITSESFDTHVPDIVKTAEDVKADDEKEKAETDTENRPISSDDVADSPDGASASMEDDNIEVSKQPKNDAENNEDNLKEESERAAETEEVSEHGPYTGYTEAAHKALTSYLATEDSEDNYVEIYAASDSIKITSAELTELCGENTPFEIRVVGPKENVLYKYVFSTDRTFNVSNDLELKMTAVPTNDAETYLSFHKNQSLEFPVTFFYQTRYANANFELRDEDSNVITDGRSDDNGIVMLKLGATGNYNLVNTDLEKIKNSDVSTENKEDREQSKTWIALAAGIGCVAVLVCATLFIHSRKK